MPNLPSGTVTFAFTDIESSTDLLKRLGDDGYGEVLATHRRIVREAFAAHDGTEIDTQGDAFFYSFPRARQAVVAAVEVQRAHEGHEWPERTRVRVRIGLHTGEPVIGEEGYTGLDVVRAARIAAVGRGGQILLSETTRALLGWQLPEGVEVKSLGSHRLKDIDQPEPLHELRIEGIDTAPGAQPEPQVSAPHDALARPAPRDALARPAPRDALARPAPPSAPAPPASAAVPDVASIMAGLPAFVREAAEGRLSGMSSAREVIEERVLSELRDSLSRERGPGASRQRPRRRDRPPLPAPSKPSVADEIERLRTLRDSDALTEEQYTLAVERVLEREA